MAVIRGQAVVWGNDKLTFSGGIVESSNAAHHQSASYTRDSNKVDIEDAVGDVVAQVFSARKRTLNVTVLPYHASGIANAGTSLNSWCVAAGTTVSVADTSGGGVIGDMYNVISATQNRTQNGAATLDLVLEAFDDNDVTTATS